MSTSTYIFENFITSQTQIYVKAECIEQAKSILKFTVLQPENFKFVMNIK